MMNFENKVEKSVIDMEKPDKLDKPDKPEKLDMLDKSEKPEKLNKLDKFDKPDKPEKSEESEKTARPVKSEKSGKSIIIEKSNGRSSEEDFFLLQIKLWDLLAKQTERFNAGDSSSVRTEIAQDLLESVCIVLEINIDDENQTWRSLVNENLEEKLKEGLLKIEKKIAYGRKLWEYVCFHMPAVENTSMEDTIKSMKNFWKRYNYEFFAQNVECDIDYQLSSPVSESLRGIDYLNKYLENLIIENDFIKCFDSKSVEAILKSYCQDYKGLHINLFEPVAVNAIGCVLIQEDIFKLIISSEMLERIKVMFIEKSKPEIMEMLIDAAWRVCEILNLKNLESQQYMTGVAIRLAPRVYEICQYNGNLEGIFLDRSC